MHRRAVVLSELIDAALYPIDEFAVAEAIVARAMVRRSVPGVAFAAAGEAEPVRSFRHHSRARSFRLETRGRQRHV